MSDSHQSQITLFHIVEAIDGDNIYNGCGLGLTLCNEQKPCPLHFQYKAIRDDLKKMLVKGLAQENSIVTNTNRLNLISE